MSANRFPPTKFAYSNDIHQQLRHVVNEVCEVHAEFLERSVDYHKVAVELNDVMQACATALEILRTQHSVDLDQAEADMVRKNDARGYYDHNHHD